MWSDETRARYERKGRYPSDLTDEEWALIAPHLPPHPGHDPPYDVAHCSTEELLITVPDGL